MRAVLDVLMVVIDLYTWVIIASVVMSWLVAFNIVNTRNNIVAMIWDMLGRVTEPLLGPIRRMMPQLGGLDLSPIVLLLGLFFLQRVIVLYIYPNVI
jgi:YggT family protein